MAEQFETNFRAWNPTPARTGKVVMTFSTSALKWSDVDWENNQLSIQRTYSDIECLCPPFKRCEQ